MASSTCRSNPGLCPMNGDRERPRVSAVGDIFMGEASCAKEVDEASEADVDEEEMLAAAVVRSTAWGADEAEEPSRNCWRGEIKVRARAG